MNEKNKPQSKFRTPIVTVMGHVDHGKTSLLDTIRGTSVTATEHGGITQNTRAHQIVTPKGSKITFIDTPGHKAFSAMRARGAAVTDFVVLVVAADDGVQPQTKESIEFAKEAGVPIIVAINKIDITGINVIRVKQELGNYGVNIEEFGGDAMCFEISATKRIGIEKLIEGIELLAEVQELKSQPAEFGESAKAYVLESSVEKGLGSLALCILKSGNLDSKLPAATLNLQFKARAYLDQHQKRTDVVNESDPFWLVGLPEVLDTGEMVYFADSVKQIDDIQQKLQTEEVEDETIEASADGTQLLWKLIQEQQAVQAGTEQKKLNLVVKAATKGTLEAVSAELQKLGDSEKIVNILYTATGEVTEDDVKRAATANGLVISFQTNTPGNVQKLARQLKVIVRNYEIIYEMIDELAGALEGLVEPEEEEVEVARARIKQVFTLTDGKKVAGCEVVKGTILKGYRIYIERPQDSTEDAIAEVGRGKIISLRSGKTEVKEVKKGLDCGIIIDPVVTAMAEGDEIVAYKVEK